MTDAEMTQTQPVFFGNGKRPFGSGQRMSKIIVTHSDTQIDRALDHDIFPWNFMDFFNDHSFANPLTSYGESEPQPRLAGALADHFVAT